MLRFVRRRVMYGLAMATSNRSIRSATFFIQLREGHVPIIHSATSVALVLYSQLPARRYERQTAGFDVAPARELEETILQNQQRQIVADVVIILRRMGWRSHCGATLS